MGLGRRNVHFVAKNKGGKIMASLKEKASAQTPSAKEEEKWQNKKEENNNTNTKNDNPKDEVAEALKLLMDQCGGVNGVTALAKALQSKKGSLSETRDIVNNLAAAKESGYIRMTKDYKPHHRHGWLRKKAVYKIDKIGVKGIKGLSGLELAEKLIKAKSAVPSDGKGAIAVTPPRTLEDKVDDSNKITLDQLKAITAERRG